MSAGFRAARGEFLVTLDGDGQNDPADIPALLERWRAEGGDDAERGPLLLAGWRSKRRDTWVRRLSSRVANGVRSRLLGDATPDTGCGLKMFRRADFVALPFFDHMHRFFVPAMWLIGTYVSPKWAAGLGLVFVVGRILYLRGYVADPAKREIGFGLSVLPLFVLLFGALWGAGSALL